jgi:hypothetical protein
MSYVRDNGTAASLVVVGVLAVGFGAYLLLRKTRA